MWHNDEAVPTRVGTPVGIERGSTSSLEANRISSNSTYHDLGLIFRHNWTGEDIRINPVLSSDEVEPSGLHNRTTRW